MDLQSILYSIPALPRAPRDKRGNLIGPGTSKIIYNADKHGFLYPTHPPTSHCVGFVFEYILEVFREAERYDLFTKERIQQFYDHTYIILARLKRRGFAMNDQSDHAWFGAPYLLTSLGLATEVLPENARVGDFAQKWDLDSEGKFCFGHSLVIRADGLHEHDKGPALLTRSSEEPGGTKDDFYYVQHPERPRLWKIARFDFERIQAFEREDPGHDETEERESDE